MVKKLFRYHGRRIRYSSRNLLNTYRVLLLMPVVFILSYFVVYQQIYYGLITKNVKEWQLYVIPVAVVITVLIGCLLLINLLIKI